MISKKTVLILGAGASAHVGYPLGSQLVSQLCSLRGTDALNALPGGWTSDYANDFLTRLSRAGHYSIDAFLETDLERAALGKYLIARELKTREIVDCLFPPHSTNSWYQYLFNGLAGGRTLDSFRPDNLGIITFNYDRSLEAYLHHALQARFNVDGVAAMTLVRQLPIIHVHGILGSYPEVPYTAKASAEDLLEISRQIQIIHEIQDPGEQFSNKMFEAAHEMLMKSERIFFLGFGFHPDNIRRFKFFSPELMRDRLVKATLAGLGPIEHKTLAERMTSHGFPPGGSWGQGYQCDNFFGHIQALVQVVTIKRT
jgi:hypothetical protein